MMYHPAVDLRYLAIALTVACSAAGPPPKTAAREAVAPYPPGVRAAYVEACSANAPERICHCLFTVVKAHYTFAEFSAVEAELRDNKPAPAYRAFIREAAPSCRAQIGHDYPAENRKAFIDACARRSTRELCVCLFHRCSVRSSGRTTAGRWRGRGG